MHANAYELAVTLDDMDVLSDDVALLSVLSAPTAPNPAEMVILPPPDADSQCLSLLLIS